jgi:hypothetical protein
LLSYGSYGPFPRLHHGKGEETRTYTCTWPQYTII